MELIERTVNYQKAIELYKEVLACKNSKEVWILQKQILKISKKLSAEEHRDLVMEQKAMWKSTR